MVRRLAVPGCHEVHRRPGPTLGRRPGCGAAWPPGRHGLVQGQGAGRVGEPGTQQVLTGPPQGVWAVAGVVPTMGLDQEV
jgi:hypothetical protein